MNERNDDGKILILGGFGRVGQEAARYLLAATGARIVLASRSPRTLPAWVTPAWAQRVTLQTLDSAQPEALQAACAQARLVVSCIGPSGVVGDRVARACKRARTPLIDAGGYDPLLHALEAAEREAPSEVPLVINVGLLPGLSGLFPHWLIETRAAGRAVAQLDLHYVGRDAWTYNSAWDIVNSLGGFGEDRGFCYLQGQRVVSVPMRRAASKVAFPEPIGQVTTMLIYAEEIVRLALRHDIDTARVYGANIGPRAALVCLLAKLLRLYRSPGDVDRGARWLAAASARDLRKQAPAYGIRAALRYRDDDGGGSDSAVLVLSDTYRATGTVVGIAAQCLLDGEGPAAGVFMLHEAVPPERFMQRLQAQGLVRIAHEDRGAAVAAAQVSA